MSKKYALKLQDPYSSHAKIIKMMSKLGKNLNILDVGCADGYLSEIFNSMGHKVYGIEVDKDAGKKAEKYCKKVIIGDIEYTAIQFKKGFFDLIVCGDVLEHLKDPLKILRDLKEFLRDNGNIIFSTGNVANAYIRLNLLFGKFDYQERGILDKTHCKLFTLKTMKKIIDDAGLRIIDIDVAPIPLPLVIKSTSKGMPLFFIHQINYFFTKIFTKLLGFQFIALTKK